MRWFWLIALALVGCAPTAQRPAYTPTYFVDYRASLVDAALKAAFSGPNRNAPWAVINGYAECSADFLVAGMSPADKARLDAYSRGEIMLTPEEGRAIERRISAAVGGPLTLKNLDRLNGTCPDKVPLFKQYFKPA